MAKVKIEEVIDHLSSEMKRALEMTLEDVLPGANIDRNDLFRAFKRAVRRKCNTWEQVPDQYVQLD